MENRELSEAFAEEWSLAIADAALRDDEDVTERALTGKILVEAYLSEAARSVKPKAIEQTVQGEIAGVRVRGIVDLLDVDGCVFDFKTSSNAAQWHLGGTLPATYDLRDDHAGGRRAVPFGHGDQN